MEVALQQLINGLALESIYGLIGIGYTIVFGIIGMVNFAHGDFFTLSAFIVLILFMLITAVIGTGAGMVILALAAVLGMAMFFASLWNWTIERVAYRLLRGSFQPLRLETKTSGWERLT